MSSEVRNSLRSKVLGQKGNKVVIELDDGFTVEVRQMTVGQMLDSLGQPDVKKRMVQFLIDSCYVPDTDEKVFENADFDVLMTLPAGGYYQKLMDAVNTQLLPEALDKAGKA